MFPDHWWSLVCVQPSGSLNDGGQSSTWMYECLSSEFTDTCFSQPVSASVAVETSTLHLHFTCCNWAVLLQQLMLTIVATVSKRRGDHYSLWLRVFLQWPRDYKWWPFSSRAHWTLKWKWKPPSANWSQHQFWCDIFHRCYLPDHFSRVETLIGLHDEISGEATRAGVQSARPGALDTFEFSVTSDFWASPFGCIVLHADSPPHFSQPFSHQHLTRLCIVRSNTAHWAFSLQPWSAIKGLLWSAASQLKTLHKPPNIMFYSASFQHLNKNVDLEEK